MQVTGMTKEDLRLLKAQIENPAFQQWVLLMLHQGNYPTESVG